MERQKQLISLLFKIDALLENNKKIREELMEMLVEEEPKPDICDVLGIKVYLGKDYKEPEEPKIIIGEDIELEEDIDNIIYTQDYAGNIIPVIDIPRSYEGVINNTFTISDNQ